MCSIPKVNCAIIYCTENLKTEKKAIGPIKSGKWGKFFFFDPNLEFERLDTIFFFLVGTPYASLTRLNFCFDFVIVVDGKTIIALIYLSYL